MLMVCSVSGTLRNPIAKEYIRRPSTFPKMTMVEKDELIDELHTGSRRAWVILRSLKKKDIIELINIEEVEVGQKKNLTNMRKPLLIDLLCRIISTKACQTERVAVDSIDPVTRHCTFSLPPLGTQISLRSKRKSCHPSRLPLFRYCQNAACQAKLMVNYSFCKRCSCYICHSYDENKIPSFWLVCESHTQLQGKPCGLSCHLECALKVEGSSNMDNNGGTELDGSMKCRNCGCAIDLISCWRKLLMEAKDARRVSDLCSRVYLSHMILKSSVKYRDLHEIVDNLKKMLEKEVGSLNNRPVSMSRALVPRHAFRTEAQEFCSLAIASLDSMSLTTPRFNCIESPNCEVGATKENNMESDVNVQGLEEKEGKAEGEGEEKEGKAEGEGAEKEGKAEDEGKGKGRLLIDLNMLPDSHMEGTRSIDGECSKGSKERNEIKIGCKENADGYSDTRYRLTINRMRQLERDGHIDSGFRKEFLTWLSVRATPKSIMQVGVFLDIFADDPKSLAEQLVHTFGEEVRAA